MIATLRVFAVVLLLSALSLGQQQSLADIARRTRTQRKPGTRVITNEDLPRSPSPGTAPAEDESVDKQAQEEKDKGTPKDGPEALKEREKDFLARYGKEKSELDLLTRELNVLHRESQIKTTEYYADAGTRLRDPRAFYEKSKQYSDDIAVKEKAVEAARQRIEDLKEEARRAGLPTRLFE